MIFYLCNGNQLVGTQADAKPLDPDFVQIDVPTDKAGLMAYINTLLTDREVSAPEPPTEPAELPDREPEPPQPSYTELSVKIDEVFEELSLPHQLHLAALAMENARKCLAPLPGR